jgi:hypothetical protein
LRIEFLYRQTHRISPSDTNAPRDMFVIAGRLPIDARSLTLSRANSRTDQNVSDQTIVKRLNALRKDLGTHPVRMKVKQGGDAILKLAVGL